MSRLFDADLDRVYGASWDTGITSFSGWFWFNSTGVHNACRLFGRLQSSFRMICAGEDGTVGGRDLINVGIDYTGGFASYDSTTAFSGLLDQWVHVLVEMDLDDGSVVPELRINGTLETWASQTTQSGAHVSDSTQWVVGGGLSNGTDINGYASHCAFWRRALSAGEKAALAAGARPIELPTPELYYTFLEPDGFSDETGQHSTTNVGSTAANFEPPAVRALPLLFVPAGLRDLSGSIDGSSAASATLAGAGALAGTVTTSSAPSGTLAGTGALAGSVVTDSTVSGTLAGAGALAGALTGTSVAAGTLAGAGALVGTLAGASVASATLAGAGALTGTATTDTLASGTLAGAGALAGAVTTDSTTTGTLAGAGALAGAVTTDSIASATLAGAGALAGAVTTVSTADGALVGAGALAATATGLSTVGGALTGLGALGGSIGGTSTLSGTLLDSSTLSGTVAGTSVVSGVLSGAGALVGTIAGATTLSGTLTGTARYVARGAAMMSPRQSTTTFTVQGSHTTVLTNNAGRTGAVLTTANRSGGTILK